MLAFALLLLCLLLPSHQHRYLHRHCPGQPLPLCPPRISHLRLFPAPSPAFMIFVLVFNPEAHLIPSSIGLLFREVRHHHYLLLIPFFPSDQHGSLHTLPIFAPFPFSTPATTTSLEAHAHRTEALFSRLPKTQLLIHPQHRMPSQLDYRLIEPSGIQAPISHHDHLPIRWHHSFERCEQSFPIGTPFSFLPGSDDFPGDWNPTSPIHHADAEHRESLPKRTCVHRQGEFLFPLPSSQHRPQQVGEAHLHIHFPPFVPPLGLRLVRNFAQSLSQPPRWHLLDFG